MTANLSDLLGRASAVRGGEVALVDVELDQRSTWAELERAVASVATGLRDLGVGPGQRVAISLRNRTEFVVVYLATLRARLVAVPVNPRGTTGELARVLADSGASLLVADESTVTSARGAVAGLADALIGADDDLKAATTVPRLVVVGAPALPDEIGYSSLLEKEPVEFPEATDPEALAVLLYTSGTSGRPRAAMLTHRALLANLDQIGALEPPLLTTADVVLGLLPFFHVYGLNAVLGQWLAQGGRMVVVDGFDVEGTLDLIASEGITVAPVAPAVFAYWRGVSDLSQRLASVRLMLSGSAPLDPELLTDFETRSGLKVHQGYGLTEAAPVVSLTVGGEPVDPRSVGRALPGVEVRLLGEVGEDLEGDDPGEILVRGDNLFSGYWPDGEDGPDEDGWYRTGDVGYLGEDGQLFLVDRVKDLVIVSGFNVYPTEVEEAIAELPSVAEVAVVGEPDPETGEAVVAYVRRTGGLHASNDELAEEIRLHCEERLAGFKRPKQIVVADELPRTVTGKIAKGKLREARRRANLGLVE